MNENPIEPLQWRFSQCFGEKGNTDDLTEGTLHSPLSTSTRQSQANIFLLFFLFSTAADIISRVEFNPTGQYLATGDKGGRIVIFKEKVPGKDARTGESGKPLCEYDFHNEFQATSQSSTI